MCLQPCETAVKQMDMTWPFIMIGIATFVLQYAASGVFEAVLLDQTVAGLPALDVLLATTALLHWHIFDATLQGMCVRHPS